MTLKQTKEVKNIIIEFEISYKMYYLTGITIHNTVHKSNNESYNGHHF